MNLFYSWNVATSFLSEGKNHCFRALNFTLCTAAAVVHKKVCENRKFMSSVEGSIFSTKRRKQSFYVLKKIHDCETKKKNGICRRSSSLLPIQSDTLQLYFH